MTTNITAAVIFCLCNKTLPEKYVQVGSKACEDVPPGMELCYYSNTRGKWLSAGSEI